MEPQSSVDIHKLVQTQQQMAEFDECLFRGIGFSRRHLQRLEDAKQFPKRVPLGTNKIGWVETEIDEWLATKIEERNAA